jgi:hypothetical protein
MNIAMIPQYRKNMAIGVKYFFTLENGDKTGILLDIRENIDEKPYTLKSFVDDFTSPIHFDSEYNFTESFSFSEYISKHEVKTSKDVFSKDPLANIAKSSDTTIGIGRTTKHLFMSK